MRKITSIKRQQKNKNRVSIYCDGEYFGALDEKTFLDSRLKTGDELADAMWETLSVRGENEAAFNKALAYIARVMRSQKQIKEYLVKKGFEENAIDYATQKLIEYKYIDDESFAKMILSHQINVKHAGVMAIKQALYKKGIDKKTSDKVMLLYDTTEQQKNANILAEKMIKRYSKIEDAREKKRKISQAMLRRGFSWDIINQSLSHFDQES